VAKRKKRASSASSPDFLEPTKRALRERVAYRCSHPDCRHPTVGPHEDPLKVTRTGEAAHIRGRKPDAARYESSMSGEECRAVDNGIWLCRNCHALVDTDWRRYPPETLQGWKSTAEARAREEQVAGRHDAASPPPATLRSVPFTWVHDPGVDDAYFGEGDRPFRRA